MLVQLQADVAAPLPEEPGGGLLVRQTSWGTISREDVVLAAVNIVRVAGYEQMRVGSLAADPGVAAMSLCRHIRAKDDLLDEVADRLLTPAVPGQRARRAARLPQAPGPGLARRGNPGRQP